MVTKEQTEKMLDVIEGKIEKEYWVDLETFTVNAVDKNEAYEKANEWLRKNNVTIANIEEVGY